MVVLLIGELLICQFLLADTQQELSHLADAGGGLLNLRCQHLLVLQQLGRVVEQFNGFLPKSGVGLHITFHHGLRQPAATTLGTHRLLGVEDGIVLQLSP